MFSLSKLTHQFGKSAIDKTSGLEVFDVLNSHAMIQAAGYLKHVTAKKSSQGVFFRGQSKLYGSLSPTLYRDVKSGKPISDASVGRRRILLADFLESINAESKMRAVAPESREALLQHYGIRTTWLDVVDNIWVALWFACHIAQSFGWPEQFLHFEKRVTENNGKDEYAYVLLLASAYFNSTSPGYYQNNRTETIDLRVAAPSHFIRPHAQHGLLVRKLNARGTPAIDASPLHVGTIRIKLSLALDWLGTASTLTNHTLFPPAFYDYGYQELLKDIKPSEKNLGSIFRIQA
jgi:hypothetical protein